MQTARRNPFLSILSIALAAAALAACGIKGDLEAPPRAGAPAADAESRASSDKVFSGASRVQRVRTPGMDPVFPPAEWKKDQVFQSEQQRKTPSGAKKRSSDTPFILDGLL